MQKLESNMLSLSSNHDDSNVNYDQIDMLLIDLRKYIAMSVHNWNTKMSEFFKKSKFDDDNTTIDNHAVNTIQNTVSSPIEIPKPNNNNNNSKNQVSYQARDDECILGKSIILILIIRYLFKLCIGRCFFYLYV